MTLWVGTDRGLLRDGKQVDALGSVKVKCIAAEGDAIWAATDDALWRLEDNWRAVASFPDDARPRCLQPSTTGLLVGTSGAQVYRLQDDALICDDAFAEVETRGLWHTPWGGPPSIWTMCAGNGGDIWANVHVGGLVHSSDGGRSWRQTSLDIHVDVHQVCHDPASSGLLVASARGFASTGEGETWEFDNTGLPAHYLRAVATTQSAIFVSASTGPRSDEVAIHRRKRDANAFERCAPTDDWLKNNIDSPALTSTGDQVAFGTLDGRVFLSPDEGDSWSVVASDLAPVQSVLLS